MPFKSKRAQARADGTKTVWKVRDVYMRSGDDDLGENDDEEDRYEGWVVEYYPCPDAASDAPDPGRGGADVEWSPLTWMKGRGPQGKFVKWRSV
jgi:hypothetical protein